MPLRKNHTKVKLEPNNFPDPGWGNAVLTLESYGSNTSDGGIVPLYPEQQITGGMEGVPLPPRRTARRTPSAGGAFIKSY